jgi:hypothetical protein
VGRAPGARRRSHGHYYVDWNTQNLLLSDSARYRVRVFVPAAAERGTRGAPGETRGGTRELGFADVEVVRREQEFRTVDTVRTSRPLINGRTLRIKFRIDRPAVDGDGDGVFDWVDNCPAHGQRHDQRDSEPQTARATPASASACLPRQRRVPHRRGRLQPRHGPLLQPRRARRHGLLSSRRRRVCTAGLRHLTCATGSANCNGNATATAARRRPPPLANCGACGVACAAVAHSTASCAAGTCAFTCDAGWADANGSRADGCELDVTTDANCGAPGNACVSDTGGTSHLRLAARAPPSRARPGAPTATPRSPTAARSRSPPTSPTAATAERLRRRQRRRRLRARAPARSAPATPATPTATAERGRRLRDHPPRATSPTAAPAATPAPSPTPPPVCTVGRLRRRRLQRGLRRLQRQRRRRLRGQPRPVTSCGAVRQRVCAPNATPGVHRGGVLGGRLQRGLRRLRRRRRRAARPTSPRSPPAARCGVACASGPHSTPTCGAGGCGRRLRGGLRRLRPRRDNGCEVDVTSDRAHCGACGNGLRRR